MESEGTLIIRIPVTGTGPLGRLKFVTILREPGRTLRFAKDIVREWKLLNPAITTAEAVWQEEPTYL